ncbi:MAG: ABC transporter substrate-binding protein [Synergistaceae bacterium]|jgi:peptide/nickel transport system substrate-binding protein|nr:ABC transporter substrate-binding protein [Synergistaceae bacterium]
MKKIGSGAVSVILAAALLFGAVRSDAAEKQVLRYGAINMRSTLDMQFNTYPWVMDISDHVAEPLMMFDYTMKLIPVLVKSLPTPTDDGRVYRFELKPGIKFHDGTTLKASDVKFSFERMFIPENGAINSYIADMIVGAKDMLAGKATELAGFKIIDDLNFEITLENPYAPFLASIGTSYGTIYPEKACREAGKDWGLTTYFGTGPYKITKFDADNGFYVERFEDYHGTKPKLDAIDFIFVEDPNTRRMEYESGNLDVIQLDATLYPEYSKSRLSSEIGSYTPQGTIFVSPNLQDERLGNVKVREAISLAVDRKVLVSDLMNDTVSLATTFIPPSMLGFDGTVPAYERDVERAKQLMAEAGYGDGFEVDGYIRSEQMNGTPGRTLLAIQSQLREIGISINIVQVDAASWSDIRRSGKIPLYIGTWYTDFPDPDGFINSYLYSSNARTLSNNYNSPEFDKLLDDARSTSDSAKREDLYKKADRLASRVDFAVVPLFHENMFYLCKPYVKDLHKSPDNTFHFFDAYIER